MKWLRSVPALAFAGATAAAHAALPDPLAGPGARSNGVVMAPIAVGVPLEPVLSELLDAEAPGHAGAALWLGALGALGFVARRRRGR